MLHPGLRLRSGRYRLLSLVRAGATAQVWRALDVKDGTEVAVKAVPEDAGGAAAVEHEAEAVARVKHPGAVRVHATFEEAGHGLIVMELAACSLADHGEAHGPLDGPTTRGVALALAEVLAAAHAAGVVHRDVKPQNVLVMQDGSVRLADFGIARVHAQGHTRTRALLGTLPFMAPEQRRDARDVRPATDVYALAALTAWMRTGSPPGDLFVPGVIAALRGSLRAAGELDDALLDVLVAAGTHDPGERTRDGAAFAEALRGIEASLEAARVGGVGAVGPMDPLVTTADGERGRSRYEFSSGARHGAIVYRAVPALFASLIVVGMTLFVLLRSRDAAHGDVEAPAVAGASALQVDPLHLSPKPPPCTDAVRTWLDQVHMGPRETTGAALADVDADGRLDALFANHLDETVSIWWGFAGKMPTARTDVHVGRITRAPTVADMDGDKIPDLVGAEQDAGRLVFVPGLSRRAFGAPVTVAQDPAPMSALVTDIDGDDRNDVVMTHEPSIDVNLRLGQRSFITLGAQQLLYRFPSEGPHWLLPGKNGPRILLYEEGGLRQVPLHAGTAGVPFALAVHTRPIDVIPDAGDPEASILVLPAEAGVVLVRLTKNTLCQLGELGMGHRPRAVGDLDGDGLPDLVEPVTCQGCESNHVFWRGVR